MIQSFMASGMWRESYSDSTTFLKRMKRLAGLALHVLRTVYKRHDLHEASAEDDVQSYFPCSASCGARPRAEYVLWRVDAGA